MTAIFSPEAITFYRYNLSGSFTKLIFLLGAVGLFTLTSRKDRPVLYWSIAVILEVVVIVSVIKFRYYMIFLTPVVSILAGRVLSLLEYQLKYIGVLAVVLIFIYIGYNSYGLVKDDFTVRDEVVKFGRVV